MVNKLKVDYSGLNSLKRKLRPINHAEVQVGFFDKVYPGTPTEAFPDGYNDGVPVALVAYLNNIDTEESPARPFMRETIEDQQTIKSVRETILAVLSGKSLNAELNKLGRKEQELMKSIIENYDQFDSNSDAWVEVKGFDDVLQYTDFMLESVEYQVDYRK